MTKAWPFAWGLALVALVVWPFLLPGEFLWKDMAVPAHFGFIPENFGAGDLPARNVPQDGLLAFFSFFLPAPLLVRFLVVVAALSAAWGGWALARHSAGPAMALAVVNPFVIERLLQGQWSLAIAAWVLPAIAAAGLAGHRTWCWLAMFLASLTPTGGVFALITGVACARGSRITTGTVGAALCLPWVVPGILASPSAGDIAAGVHAFAPRAEQAVGTAGALATLGGIWNAEALPPSRQAGFALFGLIVVCCVIWACRKVSVPLWVLAALGMGLALSAWLAPDYAALAMEKVPGLLLFRDSQKFVMLAIPFCVAALGALEGRWKIVALVAIFLQMPDFSTSLSVLQPRPTTGIDPKLVAQINNRTAFFPQRPPLIEVPGGVAVDPYSKAVSMVHSGELSVDGVTVDLPSPRYLATSKAWEAGDMAGLEKMGIGVVVLDGRVVAETQAPAPQVPWALTLTWLGMPLIFLGVGAFRRARR